MNAASAPAWIGLAGPTASGKSALALALAAHWAKLGQRCEIISVDSALVYRGMDIGTAKPSATELASVPHHLIDIRDPAQAYSAAEFVTDAHALIAAIRARGAIPLLVGGTMLYFKALIDGIDALPPADAALRATLDARAREQGWPAMHAELARVDPVTAARLAPNDSQRIQRALEVFLQSGKPLSAHFTTRSQAQTERPAHRLIALEPLDRAWLHARITQRFDQMLDQGFLDEVRALRARGDLHPDLPSMRCVGYRQAWELLDGRVTLTQMREMSLAATRQLAKRQLTWLRSMPQRLSIACESANLLEQALATIERPA